MPSSEKGIMFNIETIDITLTLDLHRSQGWQQPAHSVTNKYIAIRRVCYYKVYEWLKFESIGNWIAKSFGYFMVCAKF